MGLIIPILIIVFCCIVIWKASDGFETSSEYLGRNMSEGVRGATINAIASSMPELFTTIFFLWFLKDTDGFSGGIGTTAGSAIFNGMIIPAVVIFAVLSSNASTKIEVSKKVILRDGLSLIIAEAILILLISGDTLMWWHGLVLMLTYGAYITYMLTSMKKVDNDDDDDDDEDDDDEIESVGFFKGLFTLNLEGLVIGNKEINTRNSWQLLILSMLIIGSACLLLVVACEFIGSDTYTFLGYEFNGLNIPIMFVAVILASAATSVPDTIISVRDAKNGNYNDAVANALGSNIFDICFALGFPLFMYCLIYGPINMDPTVVEFSSELRILLLVFTILAFFVYYIGKYMGKIKAYILLSMYILFTAYICGRSLDASWAQEISDILRNIANLIA
jgi:cation:H+ antiporter|tara:strand:- start:315 stop:1487 length:1173 start_codon:yes stop_codon:yes gene_type:complete